MLPYETMQRFAAVWRTANLSSFKTSNIASFLTNRSLIYTEGNPELGVLPVDVYNTFSVATNAVRTDYLADFATNIQPKTFVEFDVPYSTPQIGRSNDKRDELKLDLGDDFLYRSRPVNFGTDRSYWSDYTDSHNQLRRSWNNWRYRTTDVNFDSNASDIYIKRIVQTIVRDGITGVELSNTTVDTVIPGTINNVQPSHEKQTNSIDIVTTEVIESYEVKLSDYGFNADLIQSIIYSWVLIEEESGVSSIFTYDFKTISSLEPSTEFTIEPDEPDPITNKTTTKIFTTPRSVFELIEISGLNQMKTIIGVPYL